MYPKSMLGCLKEQSLPNFFSNLSIRDKTGSAVQETNNASLSDKSILDNTSNK